MAHLASEQPLNSSAHFGIRGFSMVLLALLLALVSIRYTRNPAINGDGIEYLAMSASIVNHHSPDLRKSDLTGLLENPYIQDINRSYMSRLLPVVDEGKDGVNYGYFRATNGSYYSYHFWLYPAVNAPALALANWLKKEPVNSFLFTNALLLVLASAYIARAKRYSPLQKWMLFALVWLGGSSYYVNWSSPEVFTFSMLMIAGVALKERMFFLSAFCLAAAAQQNPPIGLLSAATLLLALPAIWNNRHNARVVIGSLSKGALVGLTLVLSPAFYLLNFGTPNLIARAGQASASNISFERLVSFYLDLNQGMIVGVPGIMFASAIALLYYARRNHINKLPFRAIAVATVCALALAVPCLATINFNSGSSGMARYTLWSAVPLGLGLIELIGHMAARSWQILSAGSLIAVQLVTFGFYGTPFNGGSFLEFKAGAKFVLRHAPTLYSPVPEIFAERGLHRDGGADPNDTYFYVERGQIVRVLFDRHAGPFWLPACPGFLPALPSTPTSQSTWTYVTPPSQRCASEMPEGLHVVRRGMQGDVASVLNNPEHAKTWKACDLPAVTGSISDTCHRSAKPGANKPDFLMFGPYIHLPAGKYSVAFRVRTLAGGAGKWDVSSAASGVIASGEAQDTHGEFESIVAPFVVTPKMDGDTFEFRVYFTGTAETEVESVTLTLLP